MLNINSSSPDHLSRAPHLLEPSRGRIVVVLPPLILLIVITCASNILVIFCCRRHPRLRGVTWWYVSSLAVVDFSVGLFAMVGMTVFTLYGYWPLSPVLCTIWVTFDASYCTISIYHLCLIAWDRYHALLHPMAYRTRQQPLVRAMLMILSAWALGISIWVPVVVWVRMRAPQKEVGETQCLFLPTKTFTYVQTLVVFVLPISLLLYLYISCLIVLRRRSFNMKPIKRKHYVVKDLSKTNIVYFHLNKVATQDRLKRCQTEANINMVCDNGSRKTNNLLQIPGKNANQLTAHEHTYRIQKDDLSLDECNSSKNITHIRKALSTTDVSTLDDINRYRNTIQSSQTTVSTTPNNTQTFSTTLATSNQYKHTIRSIRTLGVLLVAFLFCWLPFCVMWPLQAFCSSCVPLELYQYAYWMAYVNSLLNPFLYVLTNKDFRDALRCQNVSCA